MSRTARLVINSTWCKGCNICVAFCPHGVLGLADDKVTILREEDCTYCRECEFRCPDFAIEVVADGIAGEST